VIQTPNNANNGIKYHAGRLLATYEAGAPLRCSVARQRVHARQPTADSRFMHIHALFPAGSAYELELSRELRTVGVCGFDGAWGTVEHWTENFTAHSKVDPATGELVYMGYNLVPVGGPPTVTVGVIDAAGRVTHRATLPVTRPSMQHDMVRCA